MSPCAVAEQHADGAVTVARLVLHPGSPSDGKPAEPCLPEAWEARGKGADRPWRQRLLEVCNDGYGGSELGSDAVAVGGGQVVFTRTGGDTDRWTASATVGLSPLALLHQEADVGNALSGDSRAASWDWTTHSGQTTWSASDCADLDLPSDDPWTYVPVPAVDAVGADPFACAARVGDAGGPELRVLLVGPKTLRVALRGARDGALRLWLASPDAADATCPSAPLVWTFALGEAVAPRPPDGGGEGPLVSLETGAGDGEIALTLTLPEALSASADVFPLVSQPGGQLSLAWLDPAGAVRAATSDPDLAAAGVLGAILPLPCDPGTGGPLPASDPGAPLIGF